MRACYPAFVVLNLTNFAFRLPAWRRLTLRPSKKKRGAADVLFEMLEVPSQLHPPPETASEA